VRGGVKNRLWKTIWVNHFREPWRTKKGTLHAHSGVLLTNRRILLF
jgi:hypothetical protein